MRFSIILAILILGGCPRWIKAVGSIAVAVKDTCDALAGGSAIGAPAGPPAPSCMAPSVSSR